MQYDIPQLLRALLAMVPDGTQAALAQKLGGDVAQPHCAYYLEKISENTAVIRQILWKRHFGE